MVKGKIRDKDEVEKGIEKRRERERIKGEVWEFSISYIKYIKQKMSERKKVAQIRTRKVTCAFITKIS